MNLTIFDSTLADSLGDLQGKFFNSTARIRGLLEAAKEYSVYRPLSKRFGTSRIFAPATAGDSQISVVGGLYALGDAIKIDITGQVENLVISSINKAAPGIFQVAGATILGLSSALMYDHEVGGLVIPPKIGLNLVQAQEYYPLPTDWIAPDQDSFDRAIGIPSTSIIGPSYYDMVYDQSLARSQVSIGASTNFGFATGGRFPFYGNPYHNPNSGLGPTQAGSITFRFEKSNFPHLQVTPAPTITKTLDFNYDGRHTIETIPEEHSGAVLDYARYYCLMSQAAILAANLNYQDDDVNEDGSENATALHTLAQAALDQWHFKITHLPIVMTG